MSAGLWKCWAAVAVALVATLVPPAHAHVPNSIESIPAVRIATINAEGYSHTAPGGRHRGRLNGATRARLIALVVKRRDLSLVGWQEMQPGRQQRALKRALGPGWGWYCLRDNCISWRRVDGWRLLAEQRIWIPYFYGRMRPMPLALMLAPDGGRVWVYNAHNPANAFGCRCERWRLDGYAREARRLDAVRERTGLPVVTVGDKNARWPAVAPTVPDWGAFAGHHGIDLMWGDAQWSGYRVLRTNRVRRATDHPVVWAAWRPSRTEPVR